MPSPPAWDLLLEPPSSPGSRPPSRPLLGLSLPLRLALCAQSAGARRVVLAAGAGELAPLLADPRLKIPVTARGAAADEIPDAAAIRAPSNLLVHRGYFGAAAAALGARDVPPGARRELRLPQERVPFSVPYGFEPIAVADRTSARTAERALLRSLRKPQDGWTSTYLNRAISLTITRLLVRTPLRPNQVSVGILAIGLAGAFLASFGDYAHLLAGAVLFQSQSVLDGCDGEMSRLTFRGSRTGEWLDTIGDDLTNYGFFTGAAWGLYRTSGWVGYLVLGLIILGSGLLGSGLEYRYLIRIGSGDLLKYPIGVGKQPATPAAGAAHSADGPPEAGPPPSKLARLVDSISPLFKRDTFVFLTLVGAVLGWLGPFLAVFAAGGVGILIAVLKAEARMAEERRAASPAPGTRGRKARSPRAPAAPG